MAASIHPEMPRSTCRLGPWRWLCAAAARLRDDRRGESALEFAIVGPTFLLMLCLTLGAGMVGFYQLLLDDAARNAARQVQINAPAASSGTGLVAAACATFGVLASDCTSSMSYNAQASSKGAGFAALAPQKLNANGKLGNTFFSSGTGFGANTNVLVQIAYPLPFSIPFVGTLLMPTNTNSIIGVATVRVEPF